MRAYKLFRVRKDGTIGPLFINARLRIEPGVWYEAEDHPTKGYAHRPGWHCSDLPKAPHLSEEGRTWFEVEIEDFYRFPRPKHQGGEWIIAKWMWVVGPVDNRRVA
jgi:hypothetical protein